MYDNTVAPDIAIGIDIGADNMVQTTLVHVAESPEARVCHQLGKTCLTMSDNAITSFLDTV